MAELVALDCHCCYVEFQGIRFSGMWMFSVFAELMFCSLRGALDVEGLGRGVRA